MAWEALEAGKLLHQQGISARVINLCTIKPLDEELILRAARDCGRIVTCEEHSVIGPVLPYRNAAVGGPDLDIEMGIADGVADLLKGPPCGEHGEGGGKGE